MNLILEYKDGNFVTTRGTIDLQYRRVYSRDLITFLDTVPIKQLSLTYVDIDMPLYVKGKDK